MAISAENYSMIARLNAAPCSTPKQGTQAATATHKAQEVGYHPEVILVGRRINDAMAAHVADQTINLMLRKGNPVLGSRILVLGLTFKENCPDVRNSKVVDLVRALQAYCTQVDVFDPWIDRDEARHEYGIDCLADIPKTGAYDAIVLAVGHQQFIAMDAQRGSGRLVSGMRWCLMSKEFLKRMLQMVGFDYQAPLVHLQAPYA